ncbi:MAK10-like protein [Tanacetum coccineum]
MGDENPICTLGDYSQPSHEGYRNTIELPVGNNVEDLTTRFLAQFFPLGRTAKLHNNILMFQQHHGESLSEAWTRFKDLLQKVPHHGIDLWLQVQIFYDHVNPVKRRTIDQSAGGKLRDHNAEESWALLEDLALYDNKSWNDPRDFAKPVKAIALPQDVPSTSDHRLIELENQVQRLMEAYLAPTQPTQVNKIITSCEVCSGPHDTHNCMKVPEQTYVDYTSSRNSMAYKSIVTISHDKREEFKKKGIKSPSKLLIPKYLSLASIKEINKNPSSPKRVHFINLIVILSTNNDTEKEDVSSTNACDLNLGGMVKGKEGVKEQGKEENEMETDMEVDEVIEEESKFETDEEVEEILEEEEDDGDGENFNLFPIMKELTHHEWLLKNPRPPWVKERIRAGSTRTTSISFFPFGMDRSPSSRDILT